MSAEVSIATRDDRAGSNEAGGRLVWIFSASRATGGPLLALLRHPKLGEVNDPGLSAHLAPIGWIPEGREYLEANRNAGDHNYFFARQYLPDLAPELGEFIARQLERQAHEIVPQRAEGARWILVHEPGAHAADSLLRLTPRSRIIAVTRHGADEVAEAVGARRLPPDQRRVVIERQARLWALQTDAIRRAYAAAPEDRRSVVRYEDLVSDPVSILESIHAWLGVETGPKLREAALARFRHLTSPDGEPGSRLDREEREIVIRIIGEKQGEVGHGE